MLKEKNIFITLILTVTAMLASATSAVACTIAGYQYQIEINNTSYGTLTIGQNCLTGQLDLPSDGLIAPVIHMRVTANETYGSREISFLRNDAYPQLYTGWLSSDGKVMTGNLVNTSQSIPSLEKFPFYAIAP